MVVMIAMRIISFFYIAISNLYVMSPVIPMGKKNPQKQLKETISLTMCFFTLKLVHALYSLIAHLCIEFGCFSNKYGHSLSNLCKNSKSVKPCLVNGIL